MPPSTTPAQDVREMSSEIQWLSVAHKIHCRLGYALPDGDGHLKKLKRINFSSHNRRFKTPLNSMPPSTTPAQDVRGMSSEIQWLRVAHKIHCRLWYALPGGDGHLKKSQTAKFQVQNSSFHTPLNSMPSSTTLAHQVRTLLFKLHALPTRFTSGWGTCSLEVMGV